MKAIFLPSLHRFIKSSIHTQRQTQLGYEILVCSDCGIRVKKYIDEDSALTPLQDYPDKLLKFCNKEEKIQPGKKIMVKEPWTIGAENQGILPFTTHTIIPTPKKEDTKQGVWIAGKEFPVKVFYDELIFCIIGQSKRKLKR